MKVTEVLHGMNFTYVSGDGDWGTLSFLSKSDDSSDGRVSLENSDSLCVSITTMSRGSHGG